MAGLLIEGRDAESVQLPPRGCWPRLDDIQIVLAISLFYQIGDNCFSIYIFFVVNGLRGFGA